VAVIQSFECVGNVLVEISPSAGDTVQTIFEVSPVRALQKLGLTADHSTVNTYLKNLTLYTEVNSIPEADFPKFELDDSETDQLVKALSTAWKEARLELKLWIKKNNSKWYPRAIVSVQNPTIYPYKTYNLLDLLTDALSYEAADYFAIGVSIQDAGWGGIKGNDILIIDGSYKQSYIVVNPEIDVLKEVVQNFPGSVNDELIGTRSIDDDAFLGGSNTGTLTQILNSLSHQIKTITGKDSWKKFSTINLQDLEKFKLLTDSQYEDIKDINRIRNLITDINNNLLSLADLAITTDNIGNFLGSAWINLDLTNNWHNWTEINSYTPSFRLYKDGTLEIRGGIRATNPPAYFETIAQLPPGYRPTKTIYVQAVGNPASQIAIEPSGLISYQAGDAQVGIYMQVRFSIVEG
jgi:hypothetical protein